VSNTATAIDRGKATTTTTVRVRFCETDLMGIVHHATYLVYFEAGRVEWLRRRGIVYSDWIARGIQVPVATAELQYRAPSRFDDVLAIETTLVRLRTVSLDYTYRILREETLIAEGATRLACIDGQSKLLRIPDDIREALLAGERA
jgi:acyl-CoA thioester hydrolase